MAPPLLAVQYLFWVSLLVMLMISFLSKNWLLSLFFIEFFQSVGQLLYINKPNAMNLDSYLRIFYDVHFNFYKLMTDPAHKYIPENLMMKNLINPKILLHEQSYLLYFTGFLLPAAYVFLFLVSILIRPLRKHSLFISAIVLFLCGSEVLTKCFLQLQYDKYNTVSDQATQLSQTLAICILSYALVAFFVMLFKLSYFHLNLVIEKKPEIGASIEKTQNRIHVVNISFNDRLVYENISLTTQFQRLFPIFLAIKKFVVAATLVCLFLYPLSQIKIKLACEVIQLIFLAFSGVFLGRVAKFFSIFLQMFLVSIHATYYLMSDSAARPDVEQQMIDFIVLSLFMFILVFNIGGLTLLGIMLKKLITTCILRRKRSGLSSQSSSRQDIFDQIKGGRLPAKTHTGTQIFPQQQRDNPQKLQVIDQSTDKFVNNNKDASALDQQESPARLMQKGEPGNSSGSSPAQKVPQIGSQTQLQDSQVYVSQQNSRRFLVEQNSFDSDNAQQLQQNEMSFNLVNRLKTVSEEQENEAQNQKDPSRPQAQEDAKSSSQHPESVDA